MEKWNRGEIDWNSTNHQYFSLPHRAHAASLHRLGSCLCVLGRRTSGLVWDAPLMMEVWKDVVIPSVLRQTQVSLTASQEFLDACGMTEMSLNELKSKVDAKWLCSGFTAAHCQGMAHLTATGAMSIQTLEYVAHPTPTTDSSR